MVVQFWVMVFSLFELACILPSGDICYGWHGTVIGQRRKDGLKLFILSLNLFRKRGIEEHFKVQITLYWFIIDWIDF